MRTPVDYVIVRNISNREADHGLVRTFGYVPGESFYLTEVEVDAHNMPVVSDWEMHIAKAARFDAKRAAELVSFYRSLDDVISTVVEHSTEPPLPQGDA